MESECRTGLWSGAAGLQGVVFGGSGTERNTGLKQSGFEGLDTTLKICHSLIGETWGWSSWPLGGFCDVWRAGKQVGVALLARAGLTGKSGDERVALWIAFERRGHAVKRGENGGDIVEGEEPVCAAAELAGGLRATEEKEAEQRGFVAAEVEHGAGAVFVAFYAGSVVGADKVLVFEGSQGGVGVSLGELQDGIARRLLVAGGEEGVEGKRVGLGRGGFLFHQGTEDAGFCGGEEHDSTIVRCESLLVRNKVQVCPLRFALVATGYAGSLKAQACGIGLKSAAL